MVTAKRAAIRREEENMPATPTDRAAPFLIGDHLAIDFLNSISGDGTEWLGSGRDLVDWLEAAGAVAPEVAKMFREAGGSSRLDAVAERARGLREWLRGCLRAHAADGMTESALAALKPLNGLLAADDSYGQVAAAEEGPRGHRHLH